MWPYITISIIIVMFIVSATWSNFDSSFGFKQNKGCDDSEREKQVEHSHGQQLRLWLEQWLK